MTHDRGSGEEGGQMSRTKLSLQGEKRKEKKKKRRRLEEMGGVFGVQSHSEAPLAVCVG